MKSEEKEIHKIEKLVEKKGFLSKKEGIALYKLAKVGPGQGVIVEIGSFKGKSTIWLSCGSRLSNREKVYAIDPHNLTGHFSTIKGSIIRGVYIPQNTYKSFFKNIRKAGIGGEVIPLISLSHKAVKKWDKSIRFLFIDGSHDYLNVKRDFLLWEPFVSLGGIIAFHDSEGRLSNLFPEVKKFIQKEIISSKRFKILKIVDSTTFVQKIKKTNFFELIKNQILVNFISLEVVFKESYKLYKQVIHKIKGVIIPLIKYKIISKSKQIFLYLIHIPDRLLGKFGVFLKKRNPDLYNKLKKIEKKIRK